MSDEPVVNKMDGDPRFPIKFEPLFARMQGSQLIAAFINSLSSYSPDRLAQLMVSRYFRHHSKRDRKTLQGVVGVLCTLATLETIFTCHQSYDTLITKWGKVDALDEIIPSVPVSQVSYGVCGPGLPRIAHLACWNIQWISLEIHGLPGRLLLGIPARPILTGNPSLEAGGLMIVILMIKTGSFSTLSRNTAILIAANAIQGAGAALADILITIGLVAILKANMTGFRRASTFLSRITSLFINRALATSSISARGRITLYVISVLAILVSREGLRQDLDRSIHVSEMLLETMGKVDKDSTSQLDVPACAQSWNGVDRYIARVFRCRLGIRLVT
ncbi:hypothetical protein CC1G_11908 [Coprinopsis cinerea okayama7|uniref:Uncharacterized protein n=1 Tax=Coprinopsis cinerea (strain Okayama-7 / 130 / ATCC MYA-4618 / FGSC 9003) TaxID=240176 RepID=A8NDC9_COPC7|nr:hypothetical protein CC1G_11908 [Coprinopsis cinerea okayama7\|eukprot:XP_001832744.1 hypothetical protein CC1G_11908 [Coprinopsis cinerea okayama7\